jgi:hypothetical protein
LAGEELSVKYDPTRLFAGVSPASKLRRHQLAGDAAVLVLQDSLILRAARLDDNEVDKGILVRLALAAMNENGVSYAAKLYDLLPIRVGPP